MEKREEILKIENLKKSFGRTEVLKGINMTVYRNEIISVLGPSGCGKSTLLNIIAGMLTPDGGSVSVGGIKISERGRALPPEKRMEAIRATKKIRPFESIYLDRCVTENTVFENKFFRIEIDPDRACAESIYLKANKFEFKNSGLLREENFTREDYDRFREQYLRLPDVPWAIHDFTKPDLPADLEKNTEIGFSTRIHETVWGHGSRITLCTNRFPGFRRIEIEYVLLDYSNELEVRVRWFGKQPERLPHALWCSFASSKSRSRYAFRKMNEWVDPADVVSRGARTLHAVEEVVIDGKVMLANLDSPLVAPGKPALLNFHNRKPDLKGGVHFNLYNNVWGTNFPMWFGDNMLFRYRIKAL